MSKYDYLVHAIPTKVAALVRQTNLAPGYGHPAHTEVAAGYGPCRHCLRTFRVGEERRTLFTYDSFHGLEQVPLPGPIFIHTDGCDRYPAESGYPAEMLQHPAVLNAYHKGQQLISRTLVTEPGAHVPAIDALLSNQDVDYIEVRDLEAGCFDFRVERRR